MLLRMVRALVEPTCLEQSDPLILITAKAKRATANNLGPLSRNSSHRETARKRRAPMEPGLIDERSFVHKEWSAKA